MEGEATTSKELPLRPKKAQPEKGGKQKKPAPAPKEKVPAAPAAPVDPESMFKEGFLKTVYNEKPSDQVVTRFPPEPKFVQVISSMD